MQTTDDFRFRDWQGAKKAIVKKEFWTKTSVEIFSRMV
jgi:hypothetical protein